MLIPTPQTEYSRSPQREPSVSSSVVYPYRALVRGALAPALPLTVRGPSDTGIPVLGLLDTGADYSLFPISLATALGIDLAAAEHIEGQSASGVADYYRWAAPLSATVQGCDIELSATFSNTPVVLLGREDFFVDFEATFDQRGKRFSLKSY